MSKPRTSGVEAVRTWREVKSRWDARDDATMRQTVVGWERWALRSGRAGSDFGRAGLD